MIKTLATLGATRRISIILNYEDDAATATVILTDKKNADDTLTFQLSGTVEELDAGFAAELATAAGKIEQHTTDLAALDEQLAAQKKAKEAAVAAEKKEAPKKEAKAEKPKKPVPSTPPAEAAPATSTAGVPKPAWKQTPPPALTPAPAPAPAEQVTLTLADI